jgi:N-ethylmaleimide reductase
MNSQTDSYGGSEENRARFLFDIVQAVSSAIGAPRLGVRLSPFGQYGGIHENAVNNAAFFRSVFTGPLLSAADYTPESAALAIGQNHADAIAFGRLFIANPDLVERINGNQSLNKADRSTFYGGAEHGYTDYNTFGDAA